MGRGTLASDEALYLPVNSIHMLFMRFPIDALFLDAADAAGGSGWIAARPGSGRGRAPLSRCGMRRAWWSFPPEPSSASG